MRIKIHHILAAFLIFVLATSLWRNGHTYMKNKDFLKKIKMQYEAELSRFQELKLSIVKLQDPYEKEKIYRNDLGLQKEGEQIYRVPIEKDDK